MISFLKRIVEFITADLVAKFFIVGFSAFLWYFVNVFSGERVSINIPVETQNVPEGVVAVPRDRMMVEVNLRARGDITDSISNIKAYVDFSNARKEGESYYRVRLDGVPEGVFSSVLPYSLRIDMDNIVDATIPLSLRTRGGDNKNLLIDYKIMPDNISVQGPSRVLQRLKSVPTEILDIPSLQSTYTQVSLKVQAPEYTRTTLETVNVELWASLEMFTNLIDVPITFENVPEGKIIRDQIASVLISSRITNKAELVHRTKAFVDVENVIKPGKIMLPVHIETKDIVVSNVTPKIEIEIFE